MAIRKVDPVVLKGEVIAIADYNKIPRAGVGATIDVSWLPYTTYYYGPTPPTSPTILMLWNDTSVNQLKIYDGTNWRTFA